MQQLCTLAVLFMLAVGLTGTLGAPAAVWHRRFQVDFTETTKLLWSWQTTGKMYYDAEQNVELVTRANGQGDRYHSLTLSCCRCRTTAVSLLLLVVHAYKVCHAGAVELLMH
eukprot:GHRR01023325.1.p1 GENE.GHRR01023325.1~~GHRR01023325.1.p1  ORF type:complete len:112 (+),score=19.69 GHRR01023325.1:108-443(+)